MSAPSGANLASPARYPSRNRASIPREGVNLTKTGIPHRVRIMALAYRRRGEGRWSALREGRRGQTYRHKLSNRRRLDDHKFRITLSPFLRLPSTPAIPSRESALPHGIGRNSARNASIRASVARVSHWLHSFVLCVAVWSYCQLET